MSPNRKILKNTLNRAAVLLTGLFRRGKVGSKPVARHYLDSHAESKYLWDILEAIHGTKDTQEIRQDAASRRGERRRVNHFLTVDMILSRRAEV